MIERFLQAAPRRAATVEESALLAGWLQSEPPLLELRRRQGTEAGAVVDSLLGALGLEPRAATGSPTPTTSSRPASSTRRASTRASGARYARS